MKHFVPVYLGQLDDAENPMEYWRWHGAFLLAAGPDVIGLPPAEIVAESDKLIAELLKETPDPKVEGNK